MFRQFSTRSARWLSISLPLHLSPRSHQKKGIVDLGCLEMRHVGGKVMGFAACLMLAGCLGGGSAEDIVDNLPDDIVPIVIENEDEIREIIDRELDEDLQEEANEIIDLIVAVTTSTVSATTVTATVGTN